MGTRVCPPSGKLQREWVREVPPKLQTGVRGGDPVGRRGREGRTGAAPAGVKVSRVRCRHPSDARTWVEQSERPAGSGNGPVRSAASFSFPLGEHRESQTFPDNSRAAVHPGVRGIRRASAPFTDTVLLELDIRFFRPPLP